MYKKIVYRPGHLSATGVDMRTCFGTREVTRDVETQLPPVIQPSLTGAGTTATDPAPLHLLGGGESHLSSASVDLYWSLGTKRHDTRTESKATHAPEIHRYSASFPAVDTCTLQVQFDLMFRLFTGLQDVLNICTVNNLKIS